MKDKKVDYETFKLDRELQSLPSMPVSQVTKDKILNNVLKSKRSNRKIQNTFEFLKPVSFAVAMLLLVFIVTTRSNLVPQSAADGFYLSVDVNVKGAEIFLGSERLGETKATKKISKPGEITITKEGYTKWVGNFKGTDMEDAIKTFDALGKYQLYRGNNTIKVLVELDPIKKDTIYFATESPGAKVLLNGILVGSTPLSVTLSSVNNNIEIIQASKEKVSLEVTYDGEIKFNGDMSLTEQGYVINIPSEDLYHPIDSILINESETLVLETNGELYRGKIVDVNSNRVSIAETQFLSNYITIKDDGFIFNNKFYPDDDYAQKAYITSIGTISVESGLLTLDNGKQKRAIDNRQNPHVVGTDKNALFYQINTTLFQYDLEKQTTTTVANNLAGSVQKVQSLQNDEMILHMNEKLFRLKSGQLIELGFFEDVEKFVLIDEELLVFTFDDYIKIWKLNLEKENIRKIY